MIQSGLPRIILIDRVKIVCAPPLDFSKQWIARAVAARPRTHRRDARQRPLAGDELDIDEAEDDGGHQVDGEAQAHVGRAEEGPRSLEMSIGSFLFIVT